MFSKFAEWQWYVITIVAMLAVFGIAVMLAGKRVKWTTRMLAAGSMAAALSFSLSFIRLYRMPQGGSITLFSMLPIVLYAMAYGVGPAMLSGTAVGLLNLLHDPYVIHPMQLLLDYPLAFAMIGLGGIVRGMNSRNIWRLPLGVLIGGIGRYIVAVISGVVFFAEYAPENLDAWLYALTHFVSVDDAVAMGIVNTVPQNMHALYYSLAYNISYLGIEIILTMLICFIPVVRQLEHAVKGELG